MRRSHRHYRYIFHPSLLPGKLGIELGTDNLIYTSFYFKDKIIGRKNDISAKKRLVVRGTALSDNHVKAWITLQLKNGLEYGTTVVMSKDKLQYEIPLDQLRQIRIIGPGERGRVSVNPFTGEDGRELEIEEAETLKIIVLPNENIKKKSRVVVEYVMLE